MSQRHYIVLAGPTTLEVTDRVDLEGWELQEKAEEGAVGSGSLWLADPLMDLDVEGLRDYYVLEDTSESTDDVLFGGFVVDPELSRGEQGGTHYDPVSRMWRIQVTDRNSYWNRRVMTGTDCKRPAESDVARMQWLYASSETNWIEDPTTYLGTASPSNMDKVDYRGQYVNQVVDDAAQHTGKNWWVQLQETGTGRKDFAWYGKDGLAVYTSDLCLTNDPTDLAAYAADILAGTSVVWPIADQTVLRRDDSRVYTGVYLKYANSARAIYRTNPTSIAVYGRRDHVADYPNVKTKAKAVARATRLLNDLAEPDERITTTVELPKGKATMIRAGMRVQFKATHLAGYSSWRWLRVLACTVSPVAAGERYLLKLELQGPGTTTGAGGPPFLGDAFYSLLKSYTQGSPTYEGAYVAEGQYPPAGWSAEYPVGAMWTPVLAGDGVQWSGVESSVPMRVRVQARAWFNVVSDNSPNATMGITILGHSATLTYPYTGLEYWSDYLELDFEYDLAAGEQVILDTTQLDIRAGGWNTSPGDHSTYLRVGRGGPFSTGDGYWSGP